MKKCIDCKGEGNIELFSSFATCETCKGTGVSDPSISLKPSQVSSFSEESTKVPLNISSLEKSLDRHFDGKGFTSLKIRVNPYVLFYSPLSDYFTFEESLDSFTFKGHPLIMDEDVEPKDIHILGKITKMNSVSTKKVHLKLRAN